MTENELKELNERLIKAVGIYMNDGTGIWHFSGYDQSPTKPDFPTSMDACIKWVWPELTKYGAYEFTMSYALSNVECVIKSRFTEGLADREWQRDTMLIGSGKETALAFCLAADKYFKEIKLWNHLNYNPSNKRNGNLAGQKPYMM